MKGLLGNVVGKVESKPLKRLHLLFHFEERGYAVESLTGLLVSPSIPGRCLVQSGT